MARELRYTVPNDGTFLRIQPKIEVKSVQVANSSAHQCVVTDDRGDAVVVDPGIVKAQRVSSSVRFNAQLVSVPLGTLSTGIATLTVRDTVVEAVSGSANPTPIGRSFLLNNSTVLTIITRPTRQITLMFSGVSMPGFITADVITSTGNIPFLANIIVPNSAVPLPFTLESDVPQGSTISVQFTGTATFQVIY